MRITVRVRQHCESVQHVGYTAGWYSPVIKHVSSACLHIKVPLQSTPHTVPTSTTPTTHRLTLSPCTPHVTTITTPLPTRLPPTHTRAQPSGRLLQIEHWR